MNSKIRNLFLHFFTLRVKLKTIFLIENSVVRNNSTRYPMEPQFEFQKKTAFRKLNQQRRKQLHRNKTGMKCNAVSSITFFDNYKIVHFFRKWCLKTIQHKKIWTSGEKNTAFECFQFIRHIGFFHVQIHFNCNLYFQSYKKHFVNINKETFSVSNVQFFSYAFPKQHKKFEKTLRTYSQFNSRKIDQSVKT